MGLFSRRDRHGADQAEPAGPDAPDLFDFAAIGLPRELDPDAAVTPDGEPMPWRPPATQKSLAATLAPNTPFFATSPFGTPVALVRLEGHDMLDVASLAVAVRNGRCLLLPRYRSMPTYPILALGLAVYDREDAGPFVFEGVRDIATADVQDFLAALGEPAGTGGYGGGKGQVELWRGTGDDVEQLAAGPFTLQLPPGPEAWKKHRTTPDELRQLWQVLRLGAAWLGQLPPAERDFPKAARAFLNSGY